MIQLIRRIAQYFFSMLGLKLIPIKTFEHLSFQARFYWNDPFLKIMKNGDELRKIVNLSKSQVRQDLFVISELNFKRNGYFVEVGASDGLTGSNTFLMEKYYGWKGILVEPAHSFQTVLNQNRRSKIEYAAIWSESGIELSFLDLGRYSGLSTLEIFDNKGIHSKTRRASDAEKYSVRTLSLNDLLTKHNAPQWIDYISVDTEGSEFDILCNFDFERFRVGIFTIEHNYDDVHRNKILNLMNLMGYKRVYEQISHQDDWYVLSNSLDNLSPLRGS